MLLVSLAAPATLTQLLTTAWALPTGTDNNHHYDGGDDDIAKIIMIPITITITITPQRLPSQNMSKNIHRGFQIYQIMESLHYFDVFDNPRKVTMSAFQHCQQG